MRTGLQQRAATSRHEEDSDQADALSAYQQGRRALAEELGVDPGTELRELHHRILTSSARRP